MCITLSGKFLCRYRTLGLMFSNLNGMATQSSLLSHKIDVSSSALVGNTHAALAFVGSSQHAKQFLLVVMLGFPHHFLAVWPKQKRP